MLENIFDSHAHYDDTRFNDDRHAVLTALPQQGVTLVMNIGADLTTSAASAALAQRYPHVYAAVGVHPHDAAAVPQDYLQTLKQLAQQDKVKAIGEIGLDYYYDHSPRERQAQVFAQQLQLAAELDMPVIIHSRDAHADTMAMLQKHRPRGVVHCYSGSAQAVQEILDLGLYVGFTGVVTFKNARKSLEAVAAVPLDRLLIETDCPYMAPEPHRGKRCDSSMLVHSAQVMAQIKGIGPQALIDQTRQNAKTIFAID